MTFTAEDRSNGMLDLEMGRALTNGRSQDERWHLRKDGSPFWASGLLMGLNDENGKHLGFLKILRDRTNYKRAEDQARETEILRASEREQHRISQDLHDGLGQQLAGISCLSDTLKKDLADENSPRAAAAAKISRLLDDAVGLTRSLARGLQPVASEPHGLMSALDQMASQVSDLFKVSCRFECVQPVLVKDNAMATHLFRIAQEAVTNSIKHGRAQEIKIGLSGNSRRIVLTVGDNGAGLKKSEARRKGLGLRIMKHRAEVMGGALRVQKNNEGGVDVVCTVDKTNMQTPSNENG
jgi:signal transduction histidine kinase